MIFTTRTIIALFSILSPFKKRKHRTKKAIRFVGKQAIFRALFR